MERPLLWALAMTSPWIRRACRRLASFAVIASCAFGLPCVDEAHAEVIPPAVELPQQLSLDEAVRIFRARGLDLLIADAQVLSSEADIRIAGAVPNPTLGLSYGRVIGNYSPNVDGCAGCSNNSYAFGVSDGAAIEDTLSGKRGLRLRVARNALAAARLARLDAQRTLESQVKQAYLQVALARRSLEFSSDVAAALAHTLELSRVLTPGKITPGDLARTETQKLEADQAVDSAALVLRQARLGLAFLLGVRGRVPQFDVDNDILNYAVPPVLSATTEESLDRLAVDRRPDLRAFGYSRARAESAIALARRQVFPDLTLSLNYQQIGNGQNVIQPPTVMFGVSAPLPLFYQGQGEIRKAEADYNSQSLQHAKAMAQVISDVGNAYAAFLSSRRLVERMEAGGLLGRARFARDNTEIQYRAGKVPLIDFLDASRTYIATTQEYLQDLTNYWTAVYQLEEAVGTELRR